MHWTDKFFNDDFRLEHIDKEIYKTKSIIKRKLNPDDICKRKHEISNMLFFTSYFQILVWPLGIPLYWNPSGVVFSSLFFYVVSLHAYGKKHKKHFITGSFDCCRLFEDLSSTFLSSGRQNNLHIPR